MGFGFFGIFLSLGGLVLGLGWIVELGCGSSRVVMVVCVVFLYVGVSMVLGVIFVGSVVFCFISSSSSVFFFGGVFFCSCLFFLEVLWIGLW